ncbi:MAG TPA: hypothetical protein PLK94_08580 [Alphaproteobacteria bacterium]|nr:hypothetical protein [Alphaproteobacteria bacterium]HOO51325.1 hypothetical protein [Alphaproteobacteria bacterium]
MSSKAEELLAEYNRIVKECERFHTEMGTRDSKMVADFVTALAQNVVKLADADQAAGEVLEAARFAQLASEMHRIKNEL